MLSFLENLITFIHCFIKKVFLMLSFALEKQNVLFGPKDDASSGWDVFKNKT
jgi:hypothetical protein